MTFLFTKNKQAENEIRETTPFPIVTNNKQDENEIRETTPFPIVMNIIKYLGMTLTKEVKDLYDKNFKSLRKKLKISEDGKIVHYHGLAVSTL